MNENKERYKLQGKSLRLGKCMARARAEPEPEGSPLTEGMTAEQNAYYHRVVLRLMEFLVLDGFLSVMLDNNLKLLQSPEKAKAIGIKNIRSIHAFLDQYAELFERELQWK